MNTIFLFLSVMLFLNFTEAAESKVSTLPNGTNCTVRLSNYNIKKSFSTSSGLTYFCSGTLVNATTLVTAAHCLNESFVEQRKNLTGADENVSTHMAIGKKESSEEVTVVLGKNSTVFSTGFENYEQRSNFINRGVAAEVKHDLVVLKLKDAIKDFDARSCPQLPTESDCAEFRNYINSTDRNNAASGTELYRSREYESSQGQIKHMLNYPSPNLISANISLIKNFIDPKTEVSLGYYSIVYSSQAQDVFLKKGDSGAGFVWKNGNKKLIMGVQSATQAARKEEKNGKEKSLVSTICNYINHPNWAAFANQSQATTPTNPSEPVIAPPPSVVK